MKKSFGFVLLLISGCSLHTPVAPLPPPVLPEVSYVPPCDAKAAAGLTQEAVDALRQRDMLLRQHIERLEQQIRGM